MFPSEGGHYSTPHGAPLYGCHPQRRLYLAQTSGRGEHSSLFSPRRELRRIKSFITVMAEVSRSVIEHANQDYFL